VLEARYAVINGPYDYIYCRNTMFLLLIIVFCASAKWSIISMVVQFHNVRFGCPVISAFASSDGVRNLLPMLSRPFILLEFTLSLPCKLAAVAVALLDMANIHLLLLFLSTSQGDCDRFHFCFYHSAPIGPVPTSTHWCMDMHFHVDGVSCFQSCG
jgi:hypothetical protein